MSKSVKVYLRTRILSPSEEKDNQHQVVLPERIKEGFRVRILENAVGVAEKGEEKVLSKTFDFESGFMQGDGQDTVYNEVASPLIEAGFEKGNNSCIFAYGQTGSGKTYTMIGKKIDADPSGKKPKILDPKQEGIIPQVLRRFFAELDRVAKEQPDYTCSLNMQVVEIYCEKVRNLLPFDPRNPAALLKPRNGAIPTPELVEIYRRGLPTVRPIPLHEVGLDNSLDLMQKAYDNRATRSHNLNPDSSRGHCIYILEWQKERKEGVGATRFKMFLVDLAGREGTERTGTSGQGRLEGAAIGKSLIELETAINTMSKGRRDVVMTSALMCIMRPVFEDGFVRVLCAVSPAHSNVRETLGTLDFAQTCKKIVLNVVDHKEVDAEEEKNAEYERAIAALQAELERRRLDPEAEARLATEVSEMEAEIAALRKAEAARKRGPQVDAELSAQIARMAAEYAAATTQTTGPHLTNIEPDSMLSSTLTYPIGSDSATVFGAYDEQRPPDVIMCGVGIQKRHALVTSDEDGRLYIEPGAPKARVVIDGRLVTKATEVLHNSRVWFGQTNCLRVVIPDRTAYAWRPADEDEDWVPDYTFAVNELNCVGDGGVGGDAALLREIGSVMRMCERANAMVAELSKHIRARADYAPRLVGEDPVVVATIRDGGEVTYKARDFENMLLEMEVAYADFVSARQAGKTESFALPAGGPFDVRSHKFVFAEGSIFIAPLQHMTSLEQTVTALRSDGTVIGELIVWLYPVNANGAIAGRSGRPGEWSDDELDDDPYVDDPSELVGRSLTFEVVVAKWTEMDEHGHSEEPLYSDVTALVELPGPDGMIDTIQNGAGEPSAGASGEVYRARMTIPVPSSDAVEAIEHGSLKVLLVGGIDAAVAARRVMHSEQCSSHQRSDLKWQITKLNRDVRVSTRVGGMSVFMCAWLYSVGVIPFPSRLHANVPSAAPRPPAPQISTKQHELFAKDSEIASLHKQLVALGIDPNAV